MGFQKAKDLNKYTQYVKLTIPLVEDDVTDKVSMYFKQAVPLLAC